MLDCYKLLRLLLLTYFGYPILIVLCGLLFVFFLVGLWIPFTIVVALALVYILGIVLCKCIQNRARKVMLSLPGGEKKPKGGITLDGKCVETKVRIKSAEGKYSTFQFPDQYEAALFVIAVLKETPETKYNISKKIGTPFGRGQRYDWKPVCGNLPF